MAAPDDPRFVDGTASRITRTGLALLHERDVVWADPGSEAQSERVAQDAGATIEYRFPVEIEVRDLGDSIDVDALVERTLASLSQSVKGLG